MDSEGKDRGVAGRVQRSTPTLLRNLRSLHVLAFHPKDADGELAVAGRHPTRNELARWAGLAQPVAAGGCCSGGHCG